MAQRPTIQESTERFYSADWQRWVAWCAQHDRAALPANLEDIAEYGRQLAADEKAPPTIERALAAIANAHRANDEEIPDLGTVRRILRSPGTEIPAPRSATPTTVSVLRAMTAVCPPYTAIGTRDRALLMLGFALAARRSELVALNWEDVTTRSGLLRVHLAHRELQVDVHQGEVPRTCPVRTLRAWRRVATKAGITSGPMFLRIDRHGHLGFTANGRGSTDGRLSDRAVANIVRRTALRAGLDPQQCWAGHSLRRGLATEAYKAGTDALRIAKHGGWAPGSRALAEYVRDVDRWEASLLGDIGI